MDFACRILPFAPYMPCGNGLLTSCTGTFALGITYFIPMTPQMRLWIVLTACWTYIVLAVNIIKIIALRTLVKYRTRGELLIVRAIHLIRPDEADPLKDTGLFRLKFGVTQAA